MFRSVQRESGFGVGSSLSLSLRRIRFYGAPEPDGIPTRDGSLQRETEFEGGPSRWRSRHFDVPEQMALSQTTARSNERPILEKRHFTGKVVLRMSRSRWCHHEEWLSPMRYRG
jgi:hypothetical protein